MTKDEYGDFVLRYKGCGACFPMYHTLSRFEKMWFTAIQKDVAELEKENAELNKLRCCENCKNVNLQLHWRESEEVDKRRQFVCGTCGNRKHWEYLGKTVGITETQQLTKAKELLKDITSSYGSTEVSEAQLYLKIKKAEIFLKDSEVEK